VAAWHTCILPGRRLVGATCGLPRAHSLLTISGVKPNMPVTLAFPVVQERAVSTSAAANGENKGGKALKPPRRIAERIGVIGAGMVGKIVPLSYCSCPG
jgi:hypothetical protein